MLVLNNPPAGRGHGAVGEQREHLERQLRGVRHRVAEAVARLDGEHVVRARLRRAIRQGLTLLHISAQRKHLLWDRGCSWSV